jgi:hypothetical protein
MFLCVYCAHQSRDNKNRFIDTFICYKPKFWFSAEHSYIKSAYRGIWKDQEWWFIERNSSLPAWLNSKSYAYFIDCNTSSYAQNTPSNLTKMSLYLIYMYCYLSSITWVRQIRREKFNFSFYGSSYAIFFHFGTTTTTTTKIQKSLNSSNFRFSQSRF